MNYRLGNFLKHRLVPESVRTSVSSVHSVDGQATDAGVVKTPEDPERGLTISDVQEWFSSDSSSVLRLRPVLGSHVYLKYESILSTDLFNILFHKSLDPLNQDT